MSDFDKAELYVKNVLTQKDLDDIDTNSEEYKKYYRKRELEIRSIMIFPISKKELESKVKTQYCLHKIGFKGFD
jgi:hypothetical protein